MYRIEITWTQREKYPFDEDIDQTRYKGKGTNLLHNRADSSSERKQSLRVPDSSFPPIHQIPRE